MDVCAGRAKDRGGCAGDTACWLDAIVNNAPFGILFVSPDYEIVSANEAFARQKGLSPADLLRASMRDIFPRWEQHTMHLFERVRASGRPYSDTNYRFPSGAGTTYWDGAVVPVCSEGGLLAGFLLMQYDVTEIQALRQAEAEARNLAERRAHEWEVLFDAIPESVLVVEEPGTVVLRNKASHELWSPGAFERVSPDLNEANLWSVFHPIGPGHPAKESPSQRALRGEFVSEEHYEVLDDKGQFRHRHMTTALVPIDLGRPKRVLAIGRDVTELYKLREAERQARLAYERIAKEMTAVFDGVSDSLIIIDEDGRRTHNKAALRLEGFSADDPKSSTEVVRVFDQVLDLNGRRLDVSEYPGSRVLRGESLRDEYIRFTNLEGRQVEALVSGDLIETPVGKRAVILSKDVTELRRLERVKEEFLQVVVHELKNPLQVAKGVVQVLSMRLGVEGLHSLDKYVNTLSGQVDHLTKIVNELLNAVRTTSSGFVVSTEDMDFCEVVAEAVEPYLINPSGRQIEVYLAFGGPVRVNGDRTRIKEIVTNLLSNAIKYTPPGKRIWIRCFADSEGARLQVEDEGTGIPEEDLEKVFEGFYRSTNLSQWESGGGLGLGLYISRGIARKHGGDIWAENRKGGGTVMTLRLPLGGAKGGRPA
ncbi:MAG: ATP-binding protein [Bacillota bacterium]|nr:ATP-binding protein [Bacillota bacterium]